MFGESFSKPMYAYPVILNLVFCTQLKERSGTIPRGGRTTDMVLDSDGASCSIYYIYILKYSSLLFVAKEVTSRGPSVPFL